ncbi:hypothetical protein C9422_21220 [Pseudomonas sp. B1(2018)]|nr:hypothetical protein C9422_21220 [Pseudomonas sp. B1(2018)]
MRHWGPGITDCGTSSATKRHAIHCGSELARDGGLAGDIRVECVDLIASKLAPTMFFAYPQMLRTPAPTGVMG